MPLTGKTIIVTQSTKQAGSQIALLEELGAEVIYKPAIAVKQPDDFSAFDGCLKHINDFQWIIFTSANGVEVFGERLDRLNKNKDGMQGARIAVVGKSTAESVQSLGLHVDFIPENHTAEGLIKEFTARFTDLKDAKILFPAGNIARNTIQDGLRNAGAEVVRVTAYETTPVIYPAGVMLFLLLEEDIDLVTFTSSSTVDNFFASIAEDDRRKSVPEIRAASIGPMTSQTLRTYGLEPVVEAPVHTVSGMVEAIVHYFHDLSQRQGSE